MRAKYLSFAPSAVDTDGLADGITGAGPWDIDDFERGDTPDGLAHQLNLTSTADLAAINITITGTDADDVVISETRAGPNAATVETTKYFKTISAISAASTLGANTLDVGWVDEFVSQTIPLDSYAARPATVSLTIGGTTEIDLEDTNSNIRAGSAQDVLTWLTDANFDGATASVGGQLTTPGLRAMRVKAMSYSTGATVTLAITQAR